MDYHEVLHLQKVKRLGIMGGTFDPIHQGHLVTAEAARSEFSLDKVVFVPSGRPPHKQGLVISQKEHRYLMAVLATTANQYFEVSRTEIERPGQSYAIDTVLYFNEMLPSDTELFFITGADAILEIITWKKVEKLLEKCTFIAATRPGFKLNKLKEKLLNRLTYEHLERIRQLEVPAMAISSTDIRDRVLKGRSIKYLLPGSVENYIHKNELYRSKNE